MGFCVTNLELMPIVDVNLISSDGFFEVVGLGIVSLCICSLKVATVIGLVKVALGAVLILSISDFVERTASESLST